MRRGSVWQHWSGKLEQASPLLPDQGWAASAAQPWSGWAALAAQPCIHKKASYGCTCPGDSTSHTCHIDNQRQRAALHINSAKKRPKLCGHLCLSLQQLVIFELVFLVANRPSGGLQPKNPAQKSPAAAN